MARVRKPELVNPAMIHPKHFGEQFGMTTVKTIGQETTELAAEKAQGGKPPILEAEWSDGSANQKLAEVLHKAGVINDQTKLGAIKDDTLNLYGTHFIEHLNTSEVDAANLDVTGLVEFGNDLTVAGLVEIGDSLSVLGECEAERFSAIGSQPSVALTPVGTYPGAGTSPTLNSITGADAAFRISITTGTGTAGGNILKVTFAVAKDNGNYSVVFCAASDNAASHIARVKVTSINSTSFILDAVTALNASTTYIWNFLVI